jgi:hypothetical protein
MNGRAEPHRWQVLDQILVSSNLLAHFRIEYDVVQATP